MFTKFATLLLASSLSAHVLAAKPKPVPTPAAPVQKAWTKEPESFLGIKIGSTLEEIPECPARLRNSENILEKLRWPTLCKDSSGEKWGIIEFNGTPRLFEQFSYTLTGQMYKGQLMNLTMETNVLAFSQLKTLLVAKYDEPTGIDTSPVQTKGGVSYDNVKLNWMGKKVFIQAEQHYTSVEKAAVTITSSELLLQKHKEIEDAAVKNSDKL